MVAHYSRKKITWIIIWPVRSRAQFPWKTIREKVPYEGRTRRSDRTGKTRTALLEIRTAILETSTAKSIRVNDKNNFVAAKVCSLQNESWKLTFWEQILLFRRIVPCRTTSSVANSLQKQRNKFLNTPRKSRSQQVNWRTRKKLFRINCPIINLRYKQSQDETSFLGRHQRIHRGSKARKPKK